jgi:hypothetical protein
MILWSTARGAARKVRSDFHIETAPMSCYVNATKKPTARPFTTAAAAKVNG